MAVININYDEIDGGQVATVTIDRPEKMNALDSSMIDQLNRAFLTLAEAASLRAVILNGAGGRSWVGGADIREMAMLSSVSNARTFIQRLHIAMLSVRNLQVPVIAQVEGFCLGAGMELAAACDLRVASLSAQFGMPEVQVGLPSVIEASLLPGHIGRGRSARLVLTGEMIDAQLAYNWGFVEELVPIEQLGDTVRSLVASICRAGPHAVRVQKQLLRHWEKVNPDVASEESIETFASAFEREEPRSRLTQFLNTLG